MTFTMRDLDTRCGDGRFDINTEDAEVIVAHLDGALRSELHDQERDGLVLDKAIAHIRAGGIDQANAVLNALAIQLRATPTHA
jgi:hypothetical protein